MLSHSKFDTAHQACSSSLTVALAGKRRISAEHLGEMSASLALAFQAIDDCLIESVAHCPKNCAPPCLTLLTGLADGADQIAGRIFLSAASSTGSKRILGAVLPCGGEEFARNSPVEDREAFEAAAESCAFITVLRGRLRPAAPSGLDTDIARQARRERGDAFAAQAEALLYDADMLIAIDDPDDEGEVGGTRDTLTRAIELRMPVILIHLGRPGLRLIISGDGMEQRSYLKGLAARHAIQVLVDGVLEIEKEPAALTA